MAFLVKAYYGQIMKRLTYPEELSPTAFQNLVETLEETFAIPEDAIMCIRYTDSDRDRVLLSEQKDLLDALKVQKLNPLYLKVTVKTEEASKTGAGGLGWPFVQGDMKEQLAQMLDTSAKSIRLKAFLAGQEVKEKILSGMSSCLAAAAAATKAASTKAQETKPETDAALTKAAASCKAQENKPASEKTPKSEEIRTEQKPQSKTEETPKPKEIMTAKREFMPEPATKDNPAEKAVHSGVQCNICEVVPIKGPRYISYEQHNFNLCQACMPYYANKNERFRKVETPLPSLPFAFGPSSFKSSLQFSFGPSSLNLSPQSAFRA